MSKDSETRDEGRALVVIGSSAGGIEALSVLVGTLPANFPAPVVLAQHLDPNRPSNLDNILQRRGSLPVVVVRDSTPLQPGNVYVVPSNRHVSIKDSAVNLEVDHGDRPRPSVDRLLSSAAASYGENLIAVILTGSGSDGASGAVDVKNAGGTVIIQNPDTARYPSMPLALPPTAVDHVADLERIGPLLGQVIAGLSLREPPEKVEDPLRDVLALISRNARIDFRQYKSPTILRRINRRMAATGARAMNDYARYLEGHPEEIVELVMAFLVKVTEFFRDKDAFDYLKKTILPAIIERGRASDRTLRFWSAGCATGEEAYSLAMMLADLLGLELPQWNVRIFATDLDEDAINFARRGFYPESSTRNLPEEYRRFFEHQAHGYRVSKPIRQMIIFGQQDLSRRAPFPRIDLIVCRNLLIYFRPDLQQSILNMFAFSLHQSRGFLFLGHAETVRPSQTSFEIVSKRWKIYRCIGSPAPRLPAQPPAGAATPPYRPAPGPDGNASPPDRPARIPEVPYEVESVLLRRYNDLMLRSLPIGVVLIDRAYRIVSVNPTARRLLGIREIANNQDFLHTVRGTPYSEVRSAIDTAFRERTHMVLAELELDQALLGEQRYLHMTVAPVHLDTGALELAMITVQDVTDAVQTRRNFDTVRADQEALLKELQKANRRLTDMNKELRDANEELQATNEEMLLTQEELQATNEEFEATNEELETSNEELQATNEELETTNEELQARTSVLEQLTKALASERVRLNETVDMAPFYIMVLRGPLLVIEAFNPIYARLLQGRDPLGHPLQEVLYEPEMADLVSLAREAFKRNVVLTSPRMVAHLPDEQGQPPRAHPRQRRQGR